MLEKIESLIVGSLKFSVQSLEKRRLHLCFAKRFCSFFSMLMILFSTIAVLFAFVDDTSEKSALCFLILFVVVLIYSTVLSCYAPKFNQYKKDVKTFVLKEFFDYIHNFKYMMVNTELYSDIFYSLKKLNLFGIFDNLLLDDYLKYSNNSVEFDVYDVSLCNIANGYKTQIQRLVFGGVLVVANYDSEFTGRTVVLPKSDKRTFPDVEQVQLEDVEFNKYFNVFSSNQIEARFLLTTAFMERLLMFAKNNNHKVYCAFEKGKVFIGLSNDKRHDWFYVDLKKSLLDVNNYKSLIADLDNIEKLVCSLCLS